VLLQHLRECCQHRVHTSHELLAAGSDLGRVADGARRLLATAAAENPQ
jgi:hypothetical protein